MKITSILVPGYGVLITVLFVIFKITDIVSWNWLWIFSPIWIPLLIFGAILCILYLVVK